MKTAPALLLGVRIFRSNIITLQFVYTCDGMDAMDRESQLTAMAELFTVLGQGVITAAQKESS